MWEPLARRQPMRIFYYSERWAKGIRVLPGRNPTNLVKWWNDLELASDEIPESTIDQVELDPSARGRTVSLVEMFVAGQPADNMIRPRGPGMHPIFQRMRAPNIGVVEMKTELTRTFGFFKGENAFVGHIVDLAETVHNDRRLYDIYGSEVLKVMGRISSSEKDITTDVNTLIRD